MYPDQLISCGTRVIDQGRDETRMLDQTLAPAWAVVSVLPRHELAMLPAAQLDAHYRTVSEG